MISTSSIDPSIDELLLLQEKQYALQHLKPIGVITRETFSSMLSLDFRLKGKLDYFHQDHYHANMSHL